MLNNNFNPMMNNINQNMIFNPIMMNPMVNNMNQMIGNINNLNQQMNKEIKLIIKVENKIDVVSCFENDDIYTLRNKLNSLNFNMGYLIYNYRVLNNNTTLKDYGIGNGSIIYIKSYTKNFIFKTTKGNITNIFLDEDCPLSLAITIYCYENQISNFYELINSKSLAFLYDATPLRITDETPIKIIFRYSPNPIIIVNDLNDLRGG